MNAPKTPRRQRLWILAPVMVLACLAAACTTPPPRPTPGVQVSVFSGDFSSIITFVGGNGFDVVGSTVVGVPDGLTVDSKRLPPYPGDYPGDYDGYHSPFIRISVTADQTIAPGSYPMVVKSKVCSYAWEPYSFLPCPELHHISVSTPLVVNVLDLPQNLEPVTIPLAGRHAGELSNEGSRSTGRSINSTISADGRYVAFISNSSALVPNDTNSFPDVFVRDRQLGTTTRVSVATDGTEGNHSLGEDFTTLRAPDISADGRYVAFTSLSSNLVPNDTNGDGADVFVHDILTGETTLVSDNGSGGTFSGSSGRPSISADGRYVAFDSNVGFSPDDTDGVPDVYVHDRQTGTKKLASVDIEESDASPSAYDPSISADGTVVAFTRDRDGSVFSFSDLAVHVRDLEADTTTKIQAPVATASTDSPSISGDGNHVAFRSTEEVGQQQTLHLRNLLTDTTQLISISPNGDPIRGGFGPVVSHDGTRVAFTGADGFGACCSLYAYSVFLRDTSAGNTIRISNFAPIGGEDDYDPTGEGDRLPGGAEISSDGRHVSFSTGVLSGGIWVYDE